MLPTRLAGREDGALHIAKARPASGLSIRRIALLRHVGVADDHAVVIQPTGIAIPSAGERAEIRRRGQIVRPKSGVRRSGGVGAIAGDHPAVVDAKRGRLRSAERLSRHDPDGTRPVETGQLLVDSDYFVVVIQPLPSCVKRSGERADVLRTGLRGSKEAGVGGCCGTGPGDGAQAID